MRKSIVMVASLVLLAGVLPLQAADKKETAVLNYKMKGIDGKEVDLSQVQGQGRAVRQRRQQVRLHAAVQGLQKLYEKYGKDGFVIIGVPANEFGKQEPGTDEEIAEFCTSKYNVKFPMLSKVVVKGKEACAALQVPDVEGDEPEVRRRDQVELHQVPDRPQRRGRRTASSRRSSPEEMSKAIEEELAKK